MDRFKVIEMIGEGSFGRVFKAVERDTGQTVALKLIPKVGHSEKEISSLRSEFKIQKELSHPNIVRMLDAFETEKELISVAEFIPGELYRLFDLYKLEMGYRRLPEERVQEICGDLLSALHYLHSHRILHRDIKPQNILLDSNGRAKLCDFGFARNLGVHTLVLTSIKGTPLYMAPELIEEKPYDHTADIWSLGCIVYELLTGYPPFSTSSLFQLIKKIRYESIQWPAHLSVESRSFLQGVLEKESRKRLNWPELALHPFVKDRVCILAGSESAPLTSNLSESQELAKEIQRQDKAKLLPGNSQTLIRVAQKHELAKQKLAEFQRVNQLQGRPHKLRRFSDVGQTSGILLGRHNPKLANRRMSEAILPSMAQAHYLSPEQPLPSSAHLAQHQPVPPHRHPFLLQPLFQGSNLPSVYLGQQVSFLPNQFLHSNQVYQNTGVHNPQIKASNQQLFNLQPSSVHQNKSQAGLPSPNPHPFSSDSSLQPQQGSPYSRHNLDSANQLPTNLNPCSAPAQNIESDIAAQPVQCSRVNFQGQYSGQRSSVPIQFTSDLTSNPEKILRPSPIIKLSGNKENLENIQTEILTEEGDYSTLKNQNPSTQEMALETDLIGEHLKNLSIDSNETIKNTDAHDPRDDDDDSEALDEDENDEWNEFLDLQLKECLQELEEQKTCNSIHNSNFLLMVLPLLKSPISVSSEVVKKIVDLLVIPLYTSGKFAIPTSSYMTSLEEGGVADLLMDYLQRSDLRENLECVKSITGLLLRLVYTSRNSPQVLHSTIFPALLSIPDTQIRSNTLTILLKTIPQNLPENAPSCYEIVQVIQEENDEELLKNAMLCLILLKKYAQVDLQKMISVFSMAKCESILKTLQYES